MRIMNVKRAIIILLIIGIMAVVAGCARWPEGPEPEPETDYQLKITVEVKGVIDPADGIYYIVFDTDEESIDGPGDDLFFWDDDFYYVKLDSMDFYFAQVKDDSESLFEEGNISGNILEVTIALSDLGDPNSIDVNVVTTDSENETRDHLDSYFTISTVLYETEEGVSSNSLEDDEADFDIVIVTAEITTLY
jgi:hypothetical protein